MRPDSRISAIYIAFLATSLVIVAVLPTASLAQSLNGPETVCIGEEFGFEWNGPNGEGDKTVIADPAAPPADFLDDWNTNDGNPGTLRAPIVEGTYELRYLESASPSAFDVLVAEDILVQNCGLSQATEDPLSAILVAGVQTDYGDVITTEATAGYTLEDFCAASPMIGNAMGAIIDQIEASMASAGSPVTLSMIESLPGAPSRAEIEQDLRAAREALCEVSEQGPNTYPFVITYAHCRMAMATPTHAMEIHLPPESGTGRMSMADHATQEIVTVTLRPAVASAATVTGSGWSNPVSMNSAGSDGTRVGFPVEKFSFEYAGGLGGGGAMPAIAGLVSVKNTGTVWVSDDVPRLDIVRAFYQNLTREMQIGDGAMSFFGGLISNLVGLLQEGLPLEIDQTVSSGIAGQTTVSGRSHSIVTSVRDVTYHTGWCSQSLMPAEYTITDVDEQLSQIYDDAGMSAPEVQESMQQYQEAMQSITPEQRQVLEQMGMADMMQQAMNTGANPAAGQQAQAAAVAGGAASRAGSAMPPSAELQGANATESVQKHLQALGYEVGATDGELSLHTQIAISTFQAEKGLEVTGEVTPQLLGLLSAEVDGRR
jgi:hypothetical protein